ncbi:reverse transcriptase domain-containing protein [Tanacetum coccineum]
MCTHSQSRNSNRQQQQVPPTFVEPFNLVEPIENQAPPVVTMADNRTMAQLLEAPTEGYEDAIVVLEITADNFELKHGSARIWLEKEPPRSILTWDDLVSKFFNQFFPPSKTTNLRNEITRFQQRFNESFYEAWDRFNDLLLACPHHGFSELHQLDTFYNALNANDQDSLNSAAGGNFLDKMPRECLRIIESKYKVRNSRNKAVVSKVSSNSSTPGISPDVAALTTEVSELKNMMKPMLIDKQKTQAPAPVKAVEQSCVTCVGAHSYRNCPATDDNVYRDNIQEYVSQAAAANFNQGNTKPPMVANQIRPPGQVYQPPTSQPPVYQAQPYQAPAQQMQGVSKTDFENYVKANDAVLRNMQNQGQGSLPSNTVTNPKEDLKVITTRSGVVYQGPTIPIFFPKVMERRTEVTKDTIFPTNNGITEDVQPPIVPVEDQNPVSEPDDAPVSAPMPNLKSSIPYPSRRNDEKRRENANEQKEKFYEIFKYMSFEISFMDALTLMPNRALIDVYEGELTLRVDNEAITYNLDQTSRYSSEVLGFSDVIASGNPTPGYDIIVSNSSPTLTPFRDSDFLLLEEVDAFLALADDPTSPEVDESYYDPKGDILILEALLNSDPSPHHHRLPST